MLFDLTSHTSPPAPEVKPSTHTGAKVQKFLEMHAAKVAVVEKHIEAPPAAGEVIFVWTTAQFNTMTLIAWLIKHLGPIEELTISTYSISDICVNALFSQLDAGNIHQVYFFLSDYVPRLAPKKYDMLSAQAKARPGRVTIGLGFNHSKITLARIGKNRIVITGSGNFAENSGHEQYTICNNENIYEFYRDCIREYHPPRYRADRADAVGPAEMGH